MKNHKTIQISCILLMIIFGLVFLSQPLCTTIPIVLGDSRTPFVQAEVEGHTAWLLFDLGSSFPLALDSQLLDTLSKKRYGTSYIHNVRGNTHLLPNYVIPEITIGNQSYRYIIAYRLSDAVLEESGIGDIEFDPFPMTDVARSGEIGASLFLRSQVLLDFPNLSITISKKISINKNEFLALPFSNKDGLISFPIETDIGILTFLLDTGASASIIKESLIDHSKRKETKEYLPTWTSRQFVIGGHDFGEQQMTIFPMQFKQYQGVLGMDFLLKHVVLIDYVNKMLYIK